MPLPCCKTAEAESEEPENLSKHKNHKGHANSQLRKIWQSIIKDTKNNSVTKLYLTEPLVDLYEHKTTENDVGLAKSVFINQKFPNLKAPRLADKLSYIKFYKFFEPIIEECQGESLDSKFISDIEKQSSSTFEQFNLENSAITYCEISAVRNFKEFELIPTLKHDEHTELMNLINDIKKKIFTEMTLVEEVPKEWTDKAEKISQILKEGFHTNAENIQSIVPYRNSEDTATLGMLANYGDHLQILASDNSGKFGYIFSEICSLFSNLCLNMERFTVIPEYGFVTFNPEDFGNAFNVKMKCNLPYCARLPYIENILKEYGLSVLAIDDLVITLGNLSKLRLSEADTLGYFLESCDYVINKFEEELIHESPNAVERDLMPVECLDRLVEMIDKAYSRSYTKKYLSANLVATFKGVSTEFHGSFAHCIRYTAYFPWSVYPRACDPDAYCVYQRFFNQILMEHNKIDDFNHPLKPYYGEADKKDTFEHKYIKSYWITFVRNLKDFPFNMIMSRSHREEVEKIVCSVLNGVPGEYVKLSDIENEKGKIKSEHLIHSKTDPDVVQGLLRDWPNNRGVFIHGENSDECEILAVVNHSDHIKIHGVDFTGKKLNTLYNKMTGIMKHIDKKLSGQLAVRAHYGFLSYCPFYVGTGMKIGANVLLDNLMETDEFEKQCIKNKLFFQGTQGDGQPLIDDIVGIGFNIGMGLTEFKSMKDFIFGLTNLIEIEEKLDEDNKDFEDNKVDKENDECK